MKTRFSGGRIIRFFGGGRGGTGGAGSVSPLWVLGVELPPVEGDVWLDDGCECKEAEGTGGGEHSAKETVGRKALDRICQLHEG